MPVYQVKDANGVIHEMKGPAGLTSAQVTHFVYDHLEAQRQADEAAAAAKKQAEQEHLSKTGFFKNLSAGLTHGKGAAETYLGEVTGSQALKDWGTEAEAKARGIAEPTTAEDIANAPGVMSTAGRWAEKNLLEPTGQFLGSWAAPIAVGVAGTLAVPEEAAVGLGGLAIRGLAGKAAATAVGAPIMAGEDIQRQKEAHPDQQVNLLSTSLAGAAQSALFAFMPGAEKVHELIGPTVKAEADTLARKVIDGEMTAKEAQEALTGRTINYARSAAAHTVNAAGVMVGNEAIARAGAGQNLTDEDARNAYLESLKAAAVLGPAAGLFGAGRGEALGTIEQARLRNAKINQINAERAQQNLNIRDIKEQQAAAAAQAAADKEAQLRVMPTQQGQLPFETTVEDVAARRTETTPQIDMFNQSPDATMTMPTAEPAAETASPTKLDHDTLTSFGFKKNSIAYKALEKLGDAADNPELFNAVIEKNDHLIKTEDNQAAVDKFRSTLDANRQVEDTGAANEPGLTGETNQPSVPVLGRGKRGAARVAEEPATGNVGDVGVPPVQPRGGEAGKQAPLNLGDIVESGGVKFAKTENGFQRVEDNVPAAEKPAEVAPAAETAEPTLKPNVSAQEKVQQRINEERAAAEQQKIDDRTRAEAQAKSEQAGWEGRQATMTEAEKEGLQAAKEAEAGEPNFMKTEAEGVTPTEEDKRIAEQHAKETSAQIVWHQGDTALLRGYSVLGHPVYTVAKGGKRARFDIENDKSNLVSPELQKHLIDVKHKLEAVDAEKHANNPTLKFGNDGLLVSKNMPKEMANIVREWKKMIGIDKNIYLTTFEDAKADQYNFTGPHRAIGSIALEGENTNGIKRRMANGDYYIAFRNKASVARMLEIVSHELGHIHEQEVYEHAPIETKLAIQDEYRKWKQGLAGKSVRQHIDELRARKTAKETTIPAHLTKSEQLSPYWSSFGEWYADQVSKWATTSEQPLSVVEKFFSRLGKALRSFYAKVKNANYLPNETFKKYLENVHTKDNNNLFSSEMSERSMGFGKEEKPAPDPELNDILKRSGSEHEAEPVTSNLFKDAVNDPGRIAVETKRGIAHALTKFETMVFSSNAALNKALREGMKRAGITWEAMAHAMYNASDSQALHAQGVANEFIQRGDIRYDPLSHKYIVSGDGKGSWVGVINAIKEAAAAHGVPKDEMEQYAHRALETKRLKGLSERNDTIRARVRKLQAEGKRADAEKLESKLVHIHMSDEQIKAGMEFFDKIPELKKIEQEWHTTRGKVLDFLVDTGITDREHADELMEAMDYVPFQRVEQIMNGAGYKEYSRGLLDAAVEKRLKGSEQPVNNIFDNMERWISYSIRRGINNKTAVDLTDLALKYLPDETREVQKVSHGMDSNTISVWRDGKKHMYEFDDPLYVHAFTGIQSVGIPAITAWSKFANLLRQNIVLNPLFSIGQLSQDAFGAMFTSGVKHPTAIPLEVMKEFIRTLRGTSGAHEELKAMGAVGHRDYSAAVSRIDAETEAGLRDPKLTDKLLKPLRHLSMASDNAVRQAIYNRTLLETGGRRVGKNIVGGDKAMAAERAFEIINFRRAGASQATTMLRQTVPFFGAYLQAMNVAAKTISGRGIAPTERAAAYKTLASTTAKVMALGFIYNSLISEDEDYKKLDPAVRDRLLLIPGSGGMHVPLRQDIFTLIAKVIPEHIYQMTMAEGTEDATKAKAAIGNAVMASLLSPNMIAQGAKPVIEVMTNHDFFTGRPIVGMGIDEREPYLQYSGNTSELSKLLGSVANISPMKIDHLLKAYTGYTGSMALMATSALVSAGSGKEMPDKELQDQIASIPGMSAFVSKEFGTRDLNDYYELRTIVNTAVKSYNNLKNTGRIEEAMQYRKEHADVLKVESQVNRINQALSKLRKQESILQESDKTGAEKEAALREIQLRRHKMLQNIDEVRKRAGL